MNHASTPERSGLAIQFLGVLYWIAVGSITILNYLTGMPGQSATAAVLIGGAGFAMLAAFAAIALAVDPRDLFGFDTAAWYWSALFWLATGQLTISLDSILLGAAGDWSIYHLVFGLGSGALALLCLAAVGKQSRALIERPTGFNLSEMDF